MQLDITTLLIVTFVLTVMVGILFLFAWRQQRETPALLIWGLAHLLGALGSAGLALRGLIPDSLSIVLANAAILTGYGLIWSGVEAFEGRRFRPLLAFGGALVWLALCCLPAFYAAIGARVVVASALAAAYCTASALALRAGRAEPLPSRTVTALVLAAYAACYALRIPAAVLVPFRETRNPLQSGWVTGLCFAAMLFTLAIAFGFIALVKERAEHRQRIAASTDGLTGVANRRAFVAEAEARLARGEPVALLLFDLDHFKAVNDTHGHAVGDAVLVAFCALARALMPEAVIGRLGGEEFACLIADDGPAAVLARAERVRGAFAAVALPELPELRLAVSAGVARAAGGAFDTLMRRADNALYAAKRAGRDRVVAAPLPRAA
ncbi:GGDEF domain-containing protein [Methylobacterium radiodurans]|uniref:diguanylate cyclase n=1 Tax=Methylobacterium radiodurans TaxID=2202828 RepID=A0A2U8VQB9_9HYPH|nr:GGDEF domain-containing protein [Methylobacterium radiodurans]AWN35710.1 GGDEF domain-containing protein [Methylobacterium radiodurans]